MGITKGAHWWRSLGFFWEEMFYMSNCPYSERLELVIKRFRDSKNRPNYMEMNNLLLHLRDYNSPNAVCRESSVRMIWYFKSTRCMDNLFSCGIHSGVPAVIWVWIFLVGKVELDKIGSPTRGYVHKILVTYLRYLDNC